MALSSALWALSNNQQTLSSALPTDTLVKEAKPFLFFKKVLNFYLKFWETINYYTPYQVISNLIIGMSYPVSGADNLSGIIKFEVFVSF